MDAIAGVLSDFQWWVGAMVASSNLNVSKGLKMIVRNEDGRMVVRVADFYNEYLQKISFDMDQTHFMCLVLIDSLFEQIELDDRREDHGIQFLNLWLGGERAFTEGEEYRMNASGIHSFLTERQYIELAALGMSEFQGTEHWMSEIEFDEYVNNVDSSFPIFSIGNKDVKFTKIKNFMRVGMLKEIIHREPDAKIYLT